MGKAGAKLSGVVACVENFSEEKHRGLKFTAAQRNLYQLSTLLLSLFFIPYLRFIFIMKYFL